MRLAALCLLLVARAAAEATSEGTTTAAAETTSEGTTATTAGVSGTTPSAATTGASGTAPSATTTGASTTAPTPPPTTAEPLPDEQCHCDYTRGGCDASCCCDADCSPWVSCPEEGGGATDLCFPRYLTPHRNSSGLKGIASASGLLCIAVDNNPRRIHYDTPPLIRSEEEFRKVWARDGGRRSWRSTVPPPPAPALSLLVAAAAAPYTPGSHVWATANSSDDLSSFYYVELPTGLSGGGGRCEGAGVLRYLRSWASRCAAPPPASEQACLRTNDDRPSLARLVSLRLLSSPVYINASALQERSEEGLVAVTVVECRSGGGGGGAEEDCRPLEAGRLPPTYYHPHNSTCSGVVLKVEVVLRGNWSRGEIEEVRVRLSTGEVRTAGEEPWWTRYSAVWEGVGGGGALTARRSGGGDPFPLTLPTVGPGGLCRPHGPPVVFARDLRVHCLLDPSLPPEKQSLKWLSTGEWEVSWGDGEWAAVLEESRGGSGGECLELRLVSALVGPLSGGRPTLLGALLSPCPPPSSSPALTSSLVFLDASRRPVSRFAPSPSLSLTLPKEFFYPFLLSARSPSPRPLFPLVALLLLLLLFTL